jgi:hypothetical protein
MTIKYDWEVVSIKAKKDESGQEFIEEVTWKKIGTDEDGVVGDFLGIINAHTMPVKENAKFIPYNKLKESDVLEWVKTSAASYEDHVDRMIQKSIDEQKNVLTELPLPWKTPEKTRTK